MITKPLIPIKLLFMAALNIFLACLITDTFFLETVYNRYVQPDGWFEWTLRISGWVVASGILLLCSFGMNILLFKLLFRSSQLFKKPEPNHLDKVMAYIRLRNPNHVAEANFPENPATCEWIVQNGIPHTVIEVLIIKYISLYFDLKDNGKTIDKLRNMEIIRLDVGVPNATATLSFQDLTHLDDINQGYDHIRIPVHLRDLQLSAYGNVLVDQSVKTEQPALSSI